jgi:hypothetical protein
MSSARHAVMRGPSFTGFGKRPDLMPAHHVDLLTGIGPAGAMIEESRTKPVFGRGLCRVSEMSSAIVSLRATQHGAILDDLRVSETEFGFA